MRKNTVALTSCIPGPKFSPGPTALVAVLLVSIAFAACNADKDAQSGAGGPPPSAIGNELVDWIAISPIYEKTGLVLATSYRLRDCRKVALPDCYNRLWVSHDGGAKWKRLETGFNGSQPVIAVDSAGHETLFSMGDSNLQRSDDGGETWVGTGPRGFPTLLPTYGSDNMVAVAGGTSNYLLNAATGVTQTVTGSGGVLIDAAFAFAPEFPNSGSFPPAWLVGLDKETKRPIVQQCNAQLTCSGSSIFPEAFFYVLVPTFYPSADYSKDGVVFVQAGRFMYKSTDGGVTFKVVEIVDVASTRSKVRMIAVASRYTEAGPVRSAFAAYTARFDDILPDGGQATHTEGGLYKTTDGGRSWQKVPSNTFDKGASAVAIAPDGRFFAGFITGTVEWDGGLVCSTDGKQWKTFCPPVKASK